MPITVYCKKCGRKINAPDHTAGKQGKCPDCGVTVDVPMQSESTPPALASDGQATPASSPVGQAPSLGQGGQDSTAVETPITRLIDKGLGLARFFDSKPGRFDRFQRSLANSGVMAVLASGGMFSVALLILAIKTDSLSLSAMAAGCLVAAVVLHYVAARFVIAGSAVIRSSPTAVSSSNFGDCFGLILSLVAVGALATGAYETIKASEGWPFLLGLGVFCVAFPLGLICLNPRECLNIQTDSSQATAGETAISLYMFFFRACAVLAPGVLFFGSALSAVASMLAIVGLLVAKTHLDFAAASAALLGANISLFVASALAPLVLYLTYLSNALFADVLSAAFRIARNTEAGNPKGVSQ